jgi:hypothetical protein
MPKLACPDTWLRHAGDAGDTLVIEVSEALGPTLDAVLAVSALLEHANGDLADVPLSATVTDSANRLVTVQLGAWLQNTAVAGQSWWVSLLITAGGATMTFQERPSKRLGLQIV